MAIMYSYFSFFVSHFVFFFISSYIFEISSHKYHPFYIFYPRALDKFKCNATFPFKQMRYAVRYNFSSTLSPSNNTPVQHVSMFQRKRALYLPLALLSTLTASVHSPSAKANLTKLALRTQKMQPVCSAKGML